MRIEPFRMERIHGWLDLLSNPLMIHPDRAYQPWQGLLAIGSGAYVAALSKVREASAETSVLVVHHSKKDAPDEYRGSTVLFAALDRVLCLTMPSHPSTCARRKLRWRSRCLIW